MSAGSRFLARFIRTPAVYVGEGLLLAVSVYGIWRWAPMRIDDLWCFLGFGIAPLLLLVLIAAHTAAEKEQSASFTGYMNRIDQLQKRLNAQDDFVRSITDYAPSAMTIFNDKNEYWFVNASAARALGHDSARILGKTPSSLFGADEGRKIERHIDQTRQAGSPVEFLRQDVDAAGNPRYTQTHYEPMATIGGFSGGVIAREEDVTQILVESERSKTMLRQVISTLVAVVDRRDPYASGHSARVGTLSRLLAVEMRLPERDVETAEIAGSLMNFGKVLVSRSILTKTSALTADELQRIRDGILTSADILSLINFGMPVVPTLRQIMERVDGTGVPNRLAGDDILITARIVSVANAFIALVSPRAYRPGLDALEAASRLAQQVGAAFDVRVIAALQSYLRRHEGKLGWLTVAKPL